jgi:hypothetical protein
MEIPGSNLGRDIAYPDFRYFVVLISTPGNISGHYADWATTTSFQLLYNSLFAVHLTVRRRIVRDQLSEESHRLCKNDYETREEARAQ